VKIFSDLLKKVPDSAQILQQGAAVYMNAGRLSEALADFEKAVQLMPAWKSHLGFFIEACRQGSEF
jgi:Flp pilus assembly protein TadD